MKFRVLFLRKSHIYYIVLIMLLLIFLTILFTSNHSSPTFNLVRENKIIESDVTGDGKKDVIFIKTIKNKYSIEINTLDKSVALETDKKLNTLGSYDAANPLKIMLMDISRDKIPEIFIQSSQGTIPIQHVFYWDKNAFKDIFCSSNNVFGFMDCNNNKTPKLLSGTLSNMKIELYNYILVSGTLQSFNNNYKEYFMGRDSIFAFIKYIEGLPGTEPNKPVDIFYPGLSGDALSLIGKLAGENNTYTFQNAMFRDTRWDKDGEVSEARWIISFKGVSNINSENSKNYTVNVILKPYSKTDTSYQFKIISMYLEQ